MAKPSKIPLCLAITLGVCLSVITTDAIPSAVSSTLRSLAFTLTYLTLQAYAQDAIVPEEELSLIDATDLSHFTGSHNHLSLSCCAQLIDIAQD